MSVSSLRDDVISFICTMTGFEADQIEGNTELLTGQVISSLGIINLVSFIESAFGVVIDQEDLDIKNFDSVSSIVEMVQLKKCAVE